MHQTEQQTIDRHHQDQEQPPCHKEDYQKILETSSISSAAEFQNFFQKKSSDIAWDFLSNILCSEPTEQCFFRDCSECKDKIEQLQDELESIFDFFKVHSVTWECWDSTDRCEVTTFNNTPAKFCKVLMEKLTLYSEHFMIDKKQTKAFQTLKKELPLDSVLIIGDFSMNYSFEESRNISSAHYNKKQCTVYTAMIYMDISGLRKEQSVIIISDNPKHTYKEVYCMNYVINNYLDTFFENRKINYFWSDGAPGMASI